MPLTLRATGYTVATVSNPVLLGMQGWVRLSPCVPQRARSLLPSALHSTAYTVDAPLGTLYRLLLVDSPWVPEIPPDAFDPASHGIHDPRSRQPCTPQRAGATKLDKYMCKRNYPHRAIYFVISLYNGEVNSSMGVDNAYVRLRILDD